MPDRIVIVGIEEAIASYSNQIEELVKQRISYDARMAKIAALPQNPYFPAGIGEAKALGDSLQLGVLEIKARMQQAALEFCKRVCEEPEVDIIVKKSSVIAVDSALDRTAQLVSELKKVLDE